MLLLPCQSTVTGNSPMVTLADPAELLTNQQQGGSSPFDSSRHHTPARCCRQDGTAPMFGPVVDDPRRFIELYKHSTSRNSMRHPRTTTDCCWLGVFAVYLPTNNALSDAGHVHLFLEQLGQGIQHLASRVP